MKSYKQEYESYHIEEKVSKWLGTKEKNTEKTILKTYWNVWKTQNIKQHSSTGIVSDFQFWVGGSCSGLSYYSHQHKNTFLRIK